MVRSHRTIPRTSYQGFQHRWGADDHQVGPGAGDAHVEESARSAGAMRVDLRQGHHRRLQALVAVDGLQTLM